MVENNFSFIVKHEGHLDLMLQISAVNVAKCVERRIRMGGLK
jgi:hypothetical protein